ncbi:MAG: GNAT family N-acetyltransferase [Propionicimonas sp.]
MSAVTVSDNPAASRFEARIDGALAGFVDYELADATVAFTHTIVDPAFGGRGVGSALARYALDHVRADGTRKAVPICPFIKAWVERNPEYLALTSSDHLSRAD